MRLFAIATAVSTIIVANHNSAAAADLPVVVDPVDYVRICDAYGRGYYFIPGTDTCIRVAGRVRADYNVYFDSGSRFTVPNTVSPGFNTPLQTTTPLNPPSFVPGNGFAATGNPYRLNGNRGFSFQNDQGYRFRARGYIYLESRTATEFGLLRTFTELRFTRDNAGGTSVALEYGLIQFGGLIFGRNDSLFDFDDVDGEWQTFGRFGSDAETNIIAYQASFGNGFSAAISIEDSATRQAGVVQFNTTALPALTPPNAQNVAGTSVFFDRNANAQIPDLVANLRLDQGWGSAQVMGALHYVEAVGITFPFGGQRGDGHDDELGYAIGGGFAVNLPFGNDTTVGVQATYAHGALLYALGDQNDDMVGFIDGVIDDNGNLQLVDIFSVQGAVETRITQTILGSLAVGYANVDHASVQTDPGGFAGLESFDSDLFGFSAYAGYRPVSGMEFGLGAELLHQNMDDFGDSTAFTTFVRAQRTF